MNDKVKIAIIVAVALIVAVYIYVHYSPYNSCVRGLMSAPTVTEYQANFDCARLLGGAAK
jgi:hypothetical protein